jgi:cytochrome c oxidase subunit 4
MMVEPGGHPAGIGRYLGVFVALLVLTGVTVAVAHVDLGAWNNVVMLGIAGIKAALVVLFFMHVWDSDRLTKLTVVAGFLWLAILIGITLTDYLTRGDLRTVG